MTQITLSVEDAVRRIQGSTEYPASYIGAIFIQDHERGIKELLKLFRTGHTNLSSKLIVDVLKCNPEHFETLAEGLLEPLTERGEWYRPESPLILVQGLLEASFLSALRVLTAQPVHVGFARRLADLCISRNSIVWESLKSIHEKDKEIRSLEDLAKRFAGARPAVARSIIDYVASEIQGEIDDGAHGFKPNPLGEVILNAFFYALTNPMSCLDRLKLLAEKNLFKIDFDSGDKVVTFYVVHYSLHLACRLVEKDYPYLQGKMHRGEGYPSANYNNITRVGIVLRPF